ncbi:thioredoxin family protein [Novispirillum itersonii]|uniref:Putative thioredoxin n=1 Tax=Novispirillum itersonii TaxID=189 RepID=A0A7X0DKQ5_NOVIT|nr:co-chaperone YbbN [Novispirillum itersonii]MBB6209193.1 putative thioredoxin [Novispirillum itersonii]
MSFILDEHAPRPTAAADAVKDGTAATFMKDVIEASREVPVIAYFSAPWCGPCKTFGPMLEKQVRQSAGKVRLVKINVDEEQQLAAQLRVQAVPTVFGFVNGRPVDAFSNALPESQIKSFIARLSGGGNVIDEALAQAKAVLEEGDAATAMDIYQQILAQDPANGEGIAGVMRCYLAMGEAEPVDEILAQLPPDLLKHPAIASVKTQVELAGQASGDFAALEAQVAANPGDMQARYDLAMAYFGANRRQQAADALLDIIRLDRSWNEEQAKTQLLKLFEAFGHTDPVTMAARRKLSALLFS